MISKELLSLVLGYEIADVKDVIDNTLYFNNVNHGDYINLDTLGRLCKEFIYLQPLYDDKTYQVATLLRSDGMYRCVIGSVLGRDLQNRTSFDGETELEAIIKATEWIAYEKGLLC